MKSIKFQFFKVRKHFIVAENYNYSEIISFQNNQKCNPSIQFYGYFSNVLAHSSAPISDND